MGILRLLLASIVLASHAQVTPVYAGVFAVEGFFVISGFYMQLIIAEHYAGHAHWRRKFWCSRALRIFIPYWVVLAALMLLSLLQSDTGFLAAFSNPVSFFTNLFIIGTEHIKLARMADGCSSFYATKMFIPQIWSVGIELLFYMIAPFLLMTRNIPLLIITALSLAAKAALLHSYYMQAFTWECGDGLLNGIFPLEIGLFTTGALGYRFYRAHVKDSPALATMLCYKRLLVFLGIATIGFSFGLSDKLPVLARLISSYMYVALIALCVPYLFHASRTIRWDRILGDLSYSFYLCHLYIVQHVLTAVHLPRLIRFTLYECITLACAFTIHKMVEKPLDALRHRYFR